MRTQIDEKGVHSHNGSTGLTVRGQFQILHSNGADLIDVGPTLEELQAVILRFPQVPSRRSVEDTAGVDVEVPVSVSLDTPELEQELVAVVPEEAPTFVTSEQLEVLKKLIEESAQREVAQAKRIADLEEYVDELLKKAKLPPRKA
jgi:hypothetical protein